MLVAHREIPSALPLEPRFRAQLFYRRQRVRKRTFEPLVSVLAFVELQKALVPQQPVYVFIRKAGAVRAHGGFFEQDFEFDRCRVQLFADTRLRIFPVRIADFDIPVVIFQIGQNIAVYRRHHGGAGM